MRKLILLFSLFLTLTLSGQVHPGIIASNRAPTVVPSTLLTGLVDFWPADETTGTTLTGVVNARNFTTSNITWSNGIVFNATDDYSRRNNDAALAALGHSFTISFWVTLTQTASDAARRYVFYSYNGSSALEIFDLNSDNKVYFNITTGGGNGQAISSTTLAASTLYHIVCTYNGTNMKIYINNIDRTTGGARTGDMVLSTLYYYWGGTGSIRAPNGTMKSMGIWNKVVSTDEITELYNGGTPLNYPF
jgi:hypothetical protein